MRRGPDLVNQRSLDAAREERAERDRHQESKLAARERDRGVDLSEVKTASPFRKSTYSYASLSDAFPEVNPHHRPFGEDVLVQIRTPRRMSKGGIVLPEDSRETEIWNTQVAKVVALGPVAFHNRETLAPWPEGAWCAVGDYVRVPKYGGDRWWVDAPEHADGKALFVLFKDTDLKGQVPEEYVLDVVAYI